MRALFLLKPLSISDESPMACHGDESRFFYAFIDKFIEKVFNISRLRIDNSDIRQLLFQNVMDGNVVLACRFHAYFLTVKF